ncbi:MAG TPA: GNVR domain-containing protein [Steroidobacteraceae bacterium]|nr:GNVR domain-containing protein [Steroidobacteraceae bacterium]
MNTAVEKPTGLSGYLAIGRRRRLSMGLAFAGGMVAAMALAVLLPSHYRSSGTVLIEQQEIPTDMVRSTVTSYADERVQVISKRVMTTATLLDIIHRYNLYPRQQATDTREALLKRMRDDIGLKMISADVIDPRSGRPTEATIAFEVSYTSRSPDLAAKVANELTTLYLNENLDNRTKLARQATDFLTGEAERVNGQIVQAEAKLAAFKDKNYHKLPDLEPLNMQLLDRTEEELRDEEQRQAALEQQRVYLTAQLAELKPNAAMFSDTGERILSAHDRLKMLRSQLAAARARYAPDYPDVVTLQREVAGLERELGETPSVVNDLRRQLEQAQGELDEARKRYTADHPDRIRLEAEVKSLQSQLADALTATASHQETSDDFAALALGGDSSAPVLKPTDADNPAYVQIQAQLAGTQNDLDSLQTEIGKLRAQEDAYQADIGGAPEVEREYHDLTRDLDNARQRYQEIRTKQGEAREAQNLESDQQGERFTLIDPPLPPEQPVSPNRRMILAMGLLLSLALAAGVAWLREQVDTTVRGRDQLIKLLGVPPLALVPHIVTRAEVRLERLRMRLALGSAAGSACVALALIHVFYMPLDVLWFRLLQRFGIM